MMNQNAFFYAYVKTFNTFYLIMINYVAYREVWLVKFSFKIFWPGFYLNTSCEIVRNVLDI